MVLGQRNLNPFNPFPFTLSRLGARSLMCKTNKSGVAMKVEKVIISGK